METTYEWWDLNVHVDAKEFGSLLWLLAFFVNFPFCLSQFSERGLMIYLFVLFCSFLFLFFFNFFVFSFSYLHKEVQRFSWQQEEASYYNIVCCCAIVFGILDSLYVANEEEEN